ncbi:MAG: phosphopentomutase [Armatimonadetes bacterium 55-13]|nr:phosphopentomutase [Armatimonadota bacterium]OJU62651.1 MAG: phosphopentomutase [Armatimonadetes bacterium 55-13]
MKRAIVIVLDGCGAGAAPDADAFGDHDHPSTVKHVWEAVGGFQAPTLSALGFLAACGIESEIGLAGFGSRYGRLREISMGKDSVTGHWEMMGIHTDEAFPTYPHGFPADLMEAFEREIGIKTLGNKPASGTAIISELGPEHLRTGFPIVYTSADSVFQVACHEEVVPIERLYEMCLVARKLCQKPNHVQRVIARPFIGSEQNGFKRTERRKDFPYPAPPNLVDQIGDVYGVGVVPELFGGRGFREVKRTQSNVEHAVALKQAMASDARFIFANFEDTDMLFGHRNDPQGFAKCLEDFDGTLRGVLEALTEDDLLILTADHGNDPTDASTDHSREFVPVVVVGRSLRSENLGDTEGMMAVGATVAQQLGLNWKIGTSLIG